MKTIVQKYNLAALGLVFILLPVLFWALGDFPRRSGLKEAISVGTLLAFFLMLGQFYLSRFNPLLRAHRMSGVLKIHKFIGYTFVSLLLLHPLLIVVPRFFEAGVDPLDAFIQIITEFDSSGILLGLSAWGLLLILGLTSLLRKKLGLRYTSWRVFHGILAAIFILLAAWHAIDLGRHTSAPLAVYIGILTAGALGQLLNNYVLKSLKILKPEMVVEK